jgi:hypothetical protein
MGYFGWHLQKLIPLKILIVLAALPLFLYIFGFMIPVPKFLLRFQSKIMRSIQNVSTFKKSVFIGFLSPALPCGLLYSALGASVAAPNPLTGSFWMMMFALGTIPLMVLSQISIQFGFKFIPQKYLQPMTKAYILNQSNPEKSIMIGDGLNDGLAFKKAHLSASPLGERSPLTNQADFLFISGKLSWLLGLNKVSHQFRKVVITNLSFSAIYNVFAITLAMLGFINPLVCAILMPLSSILIIAWTLKEMKKVL